MNDFQTALVISGSILAVMIATQFGRREYTWHKVLFPLLSVAGFGYAYLRDLPTAGADLALYAAGIGIGGIFAVLATLTTTVEWNGTSKKLYTRCGVGFVATWVVAGLLRVGFVWGVENVPAFRQQVGIFMMNHQILEAAIAPFFVLMALTTVVARTIAIKVRMNRLARAVATHSTQTLSTQNPVAA